MVRMPYTSALTTLRNVSVLPSCLGVSGVAPWSLTQPPRVTTEHTRVFQILRICAWCDDVHLGNLDRPLLAWQPLGRYTDPTLQAMPIS